MNKKQLYEIATDDSQSLDDRYAAARELQGRRFTDDMILPLVKLYPHMDINDIAKELNVPPQTLGTMAQRLGLKRGIRRVMSIS